MNWKRKSCDTLAEDNNMKSVDDVSFFSRQMAGTIKWIFEKEIVQRQIETVDPFEEISHTQTLHSLIFLTFDGLWRSDWKRKGAFRRMGFEPRPPACGLELLTTRLLDCQSYVFY